MIAAIITLAVSVIEWKWQLYLSSYCIILGWTWSVKQILIQEQCIYRLLPHALRATTQANRILRFVTVAKEQVLNGMEIITWE